MPGFFYTKRLNAQDAGRLETLFTQMRTRPTGCADIYHAAKAQGLAGRKQNLLEDYRRWQAVSPAHTPETAARAETWFDNVFEPFRKKNGLTSAQATKVLKDIKSGSIDTMEQGELMGDYADKYDQAF